MGHLNEISMLPGKPQRQRRLENVAVSVCKMLQIQSVTDFFLRADILVNQYGIQNLNRSNKLTTAIKK